MHVALCGTNKLLIHAQRNELTTAFVTEHGDLALEKIDATEVSYDQILGAIESLPFLASKKMVVVSDLSQNKEASEHLEKLIERAGETTDLIIVEGKLDKRSVFYKLLKKITDFKELNELDELGIADWLVDEAKTINGKISKSDALYLIRRVGENQLKLSQEIQKLVQYNSEVTKNSIELLTEENPSSTIFNLIDGIFSGNVNQALAIYDDQRRQRVEPQAIHGMLVWQMHIVAIVSTAPSSASPAQIAKDSGLSPYVIQKSQRIAKSMGRTKILESLKLLRDIDYRGKHEPIDYDEALRYFILSLSN